MLETPLRSSAGEAIAVVSISGGKDSIATAIVAIDTYGIDRVRLVHADTGHEHPLTNAYVRNYLPTALGLPIEIVRADLNVDIARKRAFIERHWKSSGVPAARVARALEVLRPTGNPFLDVCMLKGTFPRRTAAFCTHRLKRDPLDKHMIELARGGAVIESWLGVRRDESARRADVMEWERSDLGWMVHRPIAAWTADQAFALAAERGIRPNPLYLRGMKRVGCFPCINCSKDEIVEVARFDPEAIARIREWEAIVADCSRRGGASLFCLDQNYDGMTGPEIMAATNIDAAVTWSRTSRGNKQFDLERFMPAGECSSVYGLCE